LQHHFRTPTIMKNLIFACSALLFTIAASAQYDPKALEILDA